MRIRLLIFILLLAGVIALLQDIALAEFLYWRWWWFDILMHFLGGVLVGAIGLVASDVLKTPRFLTVLIALVGIGIGWEIFEYLNGLYDEMWDTADMVIDLIMDSIGALLVYSVSKVWK